MARQRCRERGSNKRRRRSWRALVVAAATGCLIAACGGGQKTTTGPSGGGAPPPGQGGGSTGGSDPLVGRWLNTLVVQAGGDYQRIETTWVFSRDATCSRTVETFSILEDRLHFSNRGCTYLVNSGQLAVHYADAQEEVFFDFHFPEFSPDLVVIDQFRFRRVF